MRVNIDVTDMEVTAIASGGVSISLLGTGLFLSLYLPKDESKILASKITDALETELLP